MESRHLVVISGLPASGKTTVGQALARALALPLIDKDTILEALFDSLGCADREQRQLLSRASDEVLYAMAAAAGEAVLVNWWNHDAARRRLPSVSGSLVEVFCDCPLDIAATRFAARERHPGHLDRLRTAEEHKEGMAAMRETYRGPLGLGGRVIRVDTSRVFDIEHLVQEVRSAIAY